MLTSSSRRVVVTGLGVVAPNGIGKETFWANLAAGRSFVDRISAFDASAYGCSVAAQIKGFEPELFFHDSRVKNVGRFSQLAVAAAKLAVDDSAVDLEAEDPCRIVACMGTSLNGAGDVYEVARAGFDQRGVDGIPRMSGLEFAAHAPVSHVSAQLHLKGQAATIASACATGLDVLQWAHSRITAGEADLALAGSTEAPISAFCFATLAALRVLTKMSDPPHEASRPYDLTHDGIVLGEGAVVCILEEMEHAIARGAAVYAEILGFGSGNEAAYGKNVGRRSLLGISGAGELALTDAIRSAMTAARLRPDEIDWINAHGNALPYYDRLETRAFKRALGQTAYSTPVSSIKSMIGHAMGAGAAFQVAASCLALQRSLIPPTINLRTPDPECDLDYVPGTARIARLRNVLLNAHAMGGTHSVLILGSPRIP